MSCLPKHVISSHFLHISGRGQGKILCKCVENFALSYRFPMCMKSKFSSNAGCHVHAGVHIIYVPITQPYIKALTNKVILWLSDFAFVHVHPTVAKLHISTRDRYAVAMTTKHRDMKQMMLSEVIECNYKRHCKDFCFFCFLF